MRVTSFWCRFLLLGFDGSSFVFGLLDTVEHVHVLQVEKV